MNFIFVVDHLFSGETSGSITNFGFNQPWKSELDTLYLEWKYIFVAFFLKETEKEERERERNKKLELRFVRTRSCNNPWSRTDTIKSDVSEVWLNNWTNKQKIKKITITGQIR